ncbi:MAG: hypothetical protein JO289_20560, partial [Xanthobacteraceae bacterium]|nr:hypothetical protein [Xanthobacteraceae bacterium]
RLRLRRIGDTLLALHTNMGAGHMGASGRFDRLKEIALAYAFAIKVAQADAAQASSPAPVRTAAE